MRKHENAYYESFILALAISWSPFKAAAYLLPFAALFWYIIRSNSGVTFFRSTAILCAICVLVFAHLATNPDFVPLNAIIWIITHGSFLFAFAIPTKTLSSPPLLMRMQSTAATVIAFEACWGITQVLYGYTHTRSFDLANGDYAEGTIHPSLEPELSFSNVMFAANVALVIVCIMPSVIRSRRHLPAFFLGIGALIFASVVHVILFLYTAFVAAYLLVRPRIEDHKQRVMLATFAIAIPSLTALLLATNISMLSGFYLDFIAGASPRSIVLQRVADDLPREHPSMLTLGLGPGQFSSRAGMIGTGFYFGGPTEPQSLPFVEGTFSIPQKHFFWDQWLETASHTFYGSTQAPYFSWLSTYTELGGFGIIAVLFVLLLITTTLIRFSKRSHDRLLHYAALLGITLIALLGLQENYWEVPQAIFVGIMLLKVMYAVCTSDHLHHTTDAEL